MGHMYDVGMVDGEGFELYVAQVSLNLAFLQILGFGMSSHFWDKVYPCNEI